MKIIHIVLSVIILGCVGFSTFYFYAWQESKKKLAVYGFQGCVNAGYPVLESYPAQCRTPDGKSFTEYIGNELEKVDLIMVDNPRPNQKISSPLTLSGQARGYWFFEASFPMRLYDSGGNLLATAIAQAQGEWMTENFVPFKTELVFDVPMEGDGVLVFEKDNPSGLPEHDDELIVPIKFSR
jgi:hypothetical protein